MLEMENGVTEREIEQDNCSHRVHHKHGSQVSLDGYVKKNKRIATI